MKNKTLVVALLVCQSLPLTGALAQTAAVPTDFSGNYKQADAYLSDKRRWKLAEPYITRAAALAPQNARVYLLRGRLLARARRTSEAIAECRRAIALDSKLVEARVVMSECMIDRGDTTGAESILRETLKLDPRNARAHNLLGKLERQSARPKEAYAHFSEAVKLAPASLDYRVDQGETLLHLGKRAEAIQYFKSLCTTYPKSALPLVELGKLLYSDNDAALKQAEVYFRKATVVEPASSAAWRHLALSLNHQGKGAEGLKCARMALNLAPHNNEAKYFLGEVLLEQDRPGEAETYLRKAYEGTHIPARKPIYGRSLVHVLFINNKNDEAFKLASDIYKSNPNEVWSQATMASALMMTKHYSEGLRLLDRAMRQFPDSERIFMPEYITGLIGAMRYDEAKKYAKKMIAREPESRSAWFSLLEIARKEKNQKDIAVATAHVSKMRLDSQTMMTAGFDQAGGTTSDSLSLFKNALERSPEQADLLLNTRDPRSESEQKKRSGR